MKKGRPINWQNPITRGLWWAFNFDSQGAVDAVRRKTVGTYDVNATKHGDRVTFPRGSGTGDGSSVNLGVSPISEEHFSKVDGDPFTILSLFRFDTLATHPDEFPICSGVATGTADTGSILWNWTADELPHTVAAVHDGTNGYFYFDGKQRASVALASPTTINEIQFRYDYDSVDKRWDVAWYDHNSGNHEIGGTPQKVNDVWRGDIYLQLYWRRALSAAEIASLHRDPYQLFGREQIVYLKNDPFTYNLGEAQQEAPAGPGSPTITNVSPSTFKHGDTNIVVTGTNFGATQGSSTLDIDGVVQTGLTWTDTQITIPTVSIPGIPDKASYVRVDIN